MLPERSLAFAGIRLLLLVLACTAMPARADEPAEVGQLLRAGKLGEAMTRAEAYLSAKPNDPQMRFIKGVIQRSSGKQEDAIATFTKLTEDYPELPEPYNNLAVLYAGQGQFDKARAALEMAVRNNPGYATAQENLGDVYAKLASQAYGKALQLDSGNTSIAPKLALLRELFSAINKGQPAGMAPAATAPAPAASGASAVSR
jgi:tetratricopeptide (TPR) repeat protein